MMASIPDQNPDSPPVGPDDVPDQLAPARTDPDRDGHSPLEDPGSDGGTAGTGGTTGPQDHDVTS